MRYSLINEEYLCSVYSPFFHPKLANFPAGATTAFGPSYKYMQGATITSPAASRRHGVRMVSDEESERALTNMARAARKVGPNDRVVELRKVRRVERLLRLFFVGIEFLTFASLRSFPCGHLILAFCYFKASSSVD